MDLFVNSHGINDIPHSWAIKSDSGKTGYWLDTRVIAGKIWLNNAGINPWITGKHNNIVFDLACRPWFAWKPFALQWRHNEHNGVSSHQPHDCLLNRLFRQRKHQSSASLAFVRGIHRWPLKSPHKGPVTRKMFLFDDVIMNCWEPLD